MTTITLVLAVLCGWLLLAAFGELWLKAFAAWRKTADPSGEDSAAGICLARAVSALPVILLLWGVEHAVGLGRNLVWLLPFLVAASIWLCREGWSKATRQGRKTRLVLESAFLLGLLLTGYYLSQNPDLNMSSERSADLCHTVAMAQGEKLPPEDPWLPPMKADAYYTGQYYAGGWISRLCWLPPGPTYIASFILCAGWTACAVAACAWILSGQKLLATALTVLVVTLGSNFCPAFIHSTHKDFYLSESMRYLGAGLSPGSPSHTEFGKKAADFFDAAARWGKGDAKQNDLPVEALSYVFQLGDWHPQMGGFLVMAILLTGLAACANSSRADERMLGAACAAGAVPALALFNTWIAPFGAIVAATWLVPLWLQRRDEAKRQIGASVVAGLLVSASLIAPLISLGKTMDSGFASSIRPIMASDTASYTPWPGWFLIMGPAALWALLALWGNSKRESSDARASANSLMAALTTLVLLVVCEIFYVDDVYGGHFERFNTALKWYPAVLLVSTVLCAPLALASRARIVVIAGAVLAAVLVLPNAYNNFTKQIKSDPRTRWDFSGAGWITSTPAKPILETLRQLPPGIVLEWDSDKADGFTAKSLALLSGHKAWLGWPWHLKLWKGPDFKVIDARRKDAMAFYTATLENAGEWASRNRIDYITWTISLQETYEADKYPPFDPADWENRWQKNNEMLKAGYEWVETKPLPKREGLWIRKGYGETK